MKLRQVFQTYQDMRNYQADPTNDTGLLFEYNIYHGRYLDRDTGLPLAEEEMLITSDAVVTERFKVITDYVPDAFYKRLVIAVEEDPDNPGNYIGAESNVLTFYYTKNTTVAYYAVHYMMQKPGTVGDDYDLEQGNYTESDTRIEGVADVGSTITITPFTFTGFTGQDVHITRVDGTLEKQDAKDTGYVLPITAAGSEIYLFYSRNRYDFTVQYLDYNEKTKVAEEKILKDVEFGTVVTEQAKVIAGMSCVSAMTQMATCKADVEQNVIIFYYSNLQYTAEYKVWKSGAGTLTSTIEVREGLETFNGTDPEADTGYEFAGWYYDEACTTAVGNESADKADIDGTHLTPRKENLNPTPQTNVFYAKFVPTYGNLTICRKNADDEDYGDRTFIYEITSKDYPDFVTYATITGNGSVTVEGLLCGYGPTAK